MIRIYLLPIERSIDGLSRGPKYFAWPRDPDPPALCLSLWSMIDYGSIDRAVIASDITQAEHDALILNPDVYAFPEDLDANMSQQQQNVLSTFMEGFGIPAQWLSGQQTFRSVLRTITGMFLYMQRVLSLLGYPADPFAGLTLNTQYQNLSPQFQVALRQASDGLGYVWDIAPNTTLRVMLKGMADQWGSNPIYLGMVTL